MKTHTLSLETLHMLSEGLADDFQQQLEAAVQDCRQRPSLAAKREVTLKFTIIPPSRRARRRPETLRRFVRVARPRISYSSISTEKVRRQHENRH